MLNPSTHIDPALAIVVTQFFNPNGNVNIQYPTAQAIQNYNVYGLRSGTGDIAAG